MQLLSYTYPIKPFSQLLSKTIGKVYITKGTRNSLEVSGPESLLEFVGIKEENGQLELYVKDAMTFSLKSLVNLHRGSIVVRITCSEPVSEIENRGMSSIYFDANVSQDVFKVRNSGVGDISVNIETRQLEVLLKGIGNITLCGKSDNLSAKLRGSGRLDAYKLLVQEADISCDGVGMSQVNVNTKLRASVNGVGSIKYMGNPHTESSIHGLGKIERVA